MRSDGGMMMALQSLLKRASSLEKLSLCSSFGLHNVRSAITEVSLEPDLQDSRSMNVLVTFSDWQARQGGTSLVTHMEIKSDWNNVLTSTDLALMGQYFPELVSLKISQVRKPFLGKLHVMPRWAFPTQTID